MKKVLFSIFIIWCLQLFAKDVPTSVANNACFKSLGIEANVCCKIDDSVFWDTKTCCQGKRIWGKAQKEVVGSIVDSKPCEIAFERICCQTSTGYHFDYRNYCQQIGGQVKTEKKNCESDDTRICCEQNDSFFFDIRKNCRNRKGKESFDLIRCNLPKERGPERKASPVNTTT